MASPTYTLIASTTLTGSQATVTFSSIPSTYTDLVLRVSARTTRSADYDFIIFTFNSDTATNYSNTNLLGNGTTAESSNASNAVRLTYPYVDSDTATANTFGNAEVYIPSYTASQNKPISTMYVTEKNSTTQYNALIGAVAQLWRNTATISSMSLTAGVGSFMTNSTFYLYGVKNS